MTKAKAFKEITIVVFWVALSLLSTMYLLKLSIWLIMQDNILKSLLGCLTPLISFLCLIAVLNYQMYKIKWVIKKIKNKQNKI